MPKYKQGTYVRASSTLCCSGIYVSTAFSTVAKSVRNALGSTAGIRMNAERNKQLGKVFLLNLLRKMRLSRLQENCLFRFLVLERL